MAASPTMSGSSSTGSIRRCSRPRHEAVRQLEGVHGILVPGGFGERGTRGQDRGGALCPRARGAVFRHLLWHADGGDRGGARSRQPARRRLDRVRAVRAPGRRADDRMDARQHDRAAQFERAISAARCGSAPTTRCSTPGSRVAEIYGADQISERHRHRYEVNIAYKDTLEAAGLRFSGMSPDGILPEIVELPDHPWFIGVQFHPELKSTPVRAAPAVHLVRPRRARPVAAGVRRGRDMKRSMSLRAQRSNLAPRPPASPRSLRRLRLLAMTTDRLLAAQVWSA